MTTGLRSRIRRLERGGLGWSHTVETFEDNDGSTWQRFTSTPPDSSIGFAIELPTACDSAEEWQAAIARMDARRAAAEQATAAPPITNGATGILSGVLSIPNPNGSGTPLQH